MSLKRWLKEGLLGPSFEREYVTVPYAPDETYPSVILSTRHGSTTDVTATHRLLGVKPLVLGVPDEAAAGETEIALTFREPPVTCRASWKGFPTDPSAAGRMLLVRKGDVVADGHRLVLFEGRAAQNRLISLPRRLLHSAEAWRLWRKSAPHPLDLSGTLYDLIRIAYSLPRPVVVAGVEAEGVYNLFPVDFQGSLGDAHHLVSLRKGSLAARQLETGGRIAIAEVAATAATNVYALGKNHSKEPEPLGPEVASYSRRFHLPLLRETSSYLEAELVSQVDLGVQILHVLRVVERETLTSSAPTLAHVHVFFALRKTFRGEPFTYVRR